MSFTEIRQKKRNLGETVDPFSALQNKEYSDKWGGYLKTRKKN